MSDRCKHTSRLLLLGFWVCTLSSPFRLDAANWTPLTNTAPSDPYGAMFLLSDGTVMMQDSADFRHWLRLTPDSHGSYINGSWTANPIAPMGLNRLYFASQVLPDGRVWLLGGEYSGPYLDANIDPSGEVWDPVTNTWSAIPHYPDEAGGCGNQSVTSDVTVAPGANVITGIYSTARFQVGWVVSGPGIRAGTVVTSIDSATQVHVSKRVTGTSTTATLIFSGPALACFGDDPSILLSHGRILAGNIFKNTTPTYSIATNSWDATYSKEYSDPSDEEGWAKLPGGLVLNYDLFASIKAGKGYAELFNEKTNTWSGISPADTTARGFLPVLSSPDVGYELGPILRLQDGRAMVIGANNSTALYTPSANKWEAGPTITSTLSNPFGSIRNAAFGADDAPAALMPNGHVLFVADAGPTTVTVTGKTIADSPVITLPSTAGLQVYWSVVQADGTNSDIPSGAYIVSVDSPTQIHISSNAAASASLPLVLGGVFSNPSRIFDFDPDSNSVAAVSPAIPDASLDENGAYVTRMIVLPTGQVLFSDSSSQLYIYTPDGHANPALLPVITDVDYEGHGVFTLTGRRLNGPSDGSAYGDDSQSDENFPIVRLESSNGSVYYARTTNWSSTSVGNIRSETVNFTLGGSVPEGDYSLIVSGAGVSSCPVRFHFHGQRGNDH